jgi:subtilisin family serine protease
MLRRAVLCTGLAFGLALITASSALTQDAPRFQATPMEATDTSSVPKSANGMVSVIVKFDVPSVASYKGGLAGLAATSPEATGASRLAVDSPAARAYESFLAQKESAFESALRATVPGARVVHRFRWVIGGESVLLPANRLKDLSSMPGVKAVYPDELLHLDTNRSPEFIGAPTLWGEVGGQGHAGEGVIVGMIDTGIWPEHPSVADDGSYPAPPATWHGVTCQFGSANVNDPVFACNNKLIGAARFMATFDAFGGGPGTPLPNEFISARDNNGHGSHTATTAAGNAGVTASTGAVVSGIAPRAHLSIYKVCFTVADGTGGGSCYTSDSAAAIEQGILDGVNVMSFSIGGGSNPYSDAGSLAFLDAYNAGVFVAAAGGNSGPGADTVEHREPWVTTAAASTDDKGFRGSAALTAAAGPLSLTGISSSGTDITTPAPVVLSATAAGYADDLCLNPAGAGTLTGKIVACKRGTNARVAKSANVFAGGAVGMILYNVPAGATDLDADIHAVPTLHINSAQGTSLVAYLNANADAMGTITGGATDFGGQGDVTASFSSRGGPNQVLGISKPDVGAPGVNILAANSPVLAEPTLPQGQFFQIISGTSMATPHVAGAGALLHQLHPTWTPGQIKSALMMTATNAHTVKEDRVTPATPFDVGSGRIDLTVAGDPGLTISDTGANYVSLSGNLSTSNYPSLYVPVMAGRVDVQRTLKSVDSASRVWYITPLSPSDVIITTPHAVTLGAGLSQTITITVDASAVPIGQTRLASLHFTSPDAGGGQSELNFPITIVRKQAGLSLTKSCTPSTLPWNATTTCTIQFQNNNFADDTPSVFDAVPSQLTVTGVTGASQDGNLVFFQDTVHGATAPVVGVQDGSTPFGYVPLSGFGISVTPMGDDTLTNFNVPAFVFAGQTYTRIGVVSDGYIVVGGGTSADIQFLNQNLPNPTRPNNVLAPFWSDLDASPAKLPAGGGVRAGVLTAGPDSWIVVDFDHVPNFSGGPNQNTFEVWIGRNTNTNPGQDITFAYGPDGVTQGEGNLATVGAENSFGNSGQNYYYNGTGTQPTSATEIEVTSVPGTPGEIKTITINATAAQVGTWRNCAEMFSSSIFGESESCVDGSVTKADQTITFGALANKTAVDPDFGVSASSSSGLAVTFTASGQCTVNASGTIVHITAVGTCTITAHQAGNATYNPAPDVPQSFNIVKADQTITFGALADKTFGDPDFSVSATATSGLAVTFTSTGNCTVTSDGATVHLTDVGSCTITAHQAGNGNFNAAPDVPQTFAINAGDLIWRDGFESNNLSGWSASSTDGGDLSVTGAAALVGSFGLQAFVNDTNSLFVEDDHPSAESRFRARFYLDPHTFDPGVAGGHFRTRIFLALQASPSRRLVAIVLKFQDGQYSLMARVRLDDDTTVDTPFTTITAASHYVEFDWTQSTSPVAADGSLSLWIDGAPAGTLSNLNNNAGGVDLARMGVLSLKAGASGIIYFDAYESRRLNPVGP